jgi:predicted  nucleic acid-binding Zn ribbon protein
MLDSFKVIVLSISKNDEKKSVMPVAQILYKGRDVICSPIIVINSLPINNVY